MTDWKSLRLRCYSLNLYRVFGETCSSLKHTPLWNDLRENLKFVTIGHRNFRIEQQNKYQTQCKMVYSIEEHVFVRTFYETAVF